MSSHERADIQALPPDVAAKIKSSATITSLQNVIVELVKNSLDAGAKTVLISVDFKRGGCIVEDDGEGIRPAEFHPAGGLGKPHHTSKYRASGVYGHRGLFLASLASLSLLTVTSRHHKHASTNSIIFHHARPVARLIPAPAHQGLRLGEHGTRVAVNDLFGNMPVRVKSRARAFERSDESDREWESLKYMMISLMLANSQLSKLVISDSVRGKRFNVRPERSLKEMDLGRIGSIFSQSGILDPRNMDSWRVISASIPHLTIQAAISTVPGPSKKIQFIAFGKEPVLSPSSSHVLFNEVNRMMSLSDFGNTRSASGIASPMHTAPGAGRSASIIDMSSRSWAKSVSKWPMFYIRIETESLERLEDGEESPPDVEESLQGILDVLEAMISEFLKQQDMRPRASRRQSKTTGQPQIVRDFARTSTSRSDSIVQCSRSLSMKESFGNVRLLSLQRSQFANNGPHFSKWSRIKAAKRPEESVSGTRIAGVSLTSGHDHSSTEVALSLDQPQSRSTNSRYFSPQPNPIDMPQSDKITPVCDDENIRQSAVEHCSSEMATEKSIPWVDPRTGKTHRINSRTGQTVNLGAIGSGARSQSFLSTMQTLGQSHRPKSASSGLWVENMLNSWDNPTLTRAEAPLPSLDTEFDPSHDSASLRDCFGDIGDFYSAQIAKFKGKLHRESLKAAAVVAQVDRKFILAKFGSSHLGAMTNHESDNILVLIDQHAADERCRVEQLFEEMFISPGSLSRHDQVQTVEIDPLSFGISATEATLFRKYLDFFGNWGIGYRVPAQTVSEAILQIHALPALIAERCRLEPSLVVDLLRREIWNYEESGKPPGLGKTKEGFSASLNSGSGDFSAERAESIASHSWIQKMSGCPQGILDLLNSRACRGAVMFNDPLTLGECEALVKRLSRCAFPFQCAHGRPSMIPILDLRLQPGNGLQLPGAGIVGSNVGEDYEKSEAFLDAFRAQYS